MSRKDKEKGSVMKKEETVECFLELDSVNDKASKEENYFNTEKDDLHRSRGLSSATQNYLETRQKNEKVERMKSQIKLSCGFAVAATVLVVLWVGYLSTAGFLVYGIIDSPKKSQDLAFNQTYQQNELNCSSIGDAYKKYNNYVSALITSNYTYSPYNVTECADEFVSNGTHCSPECLEFTPGGRSMWWAFRVTTIFGSSFTLIATLLGMLSWINKELWKFPKVVNFYMMVTVLLQALAILSGALVPKEYYCSSENIYKSREFSTVPCLVQGAVMHYAILSFLLWYVFGITNLSIIVLSPFKGARWFFKYVHSIHVAESIIAWGFPLFVVLVNVAASFALGKQSFVYSIENVPEFCLPGIMEIQILSLHVLGFVFCLFNGTMIILIVVIMIRLKYKQQTLSRTTIVNTEWVFQLSIFTLVFSLSIWIVLLDASIYLYYENTYKTHLDVYAYCIALFPSRCCQTTYRDFYQPWLSILSGFSTSVWGIGGLAAVTNKEVRNFWKKVLTCKCREK